MMKKPSPESARSVGESVVISAPCDHICCTLLTREPPPADGTADAPAIERPSMSWKIARERLKPTVLTFAMLSPTTSIASE